MSILDHKNSTIIPLLIAEKFTGIFIATTPYSEISVSVYTDTGYILRCITVMEQVKV